MGVNSKSDVVCGSQCQCNSNYKKDKVLSDNLFAPIKNKMKVLKKIKKRMGLGMFHNIINLSFSLFLSIIYVLIFWTFYIIVFCVFCEMFRLQKYNILFL